MAISKKKDAHIWERDENDWYVEPVECSRALFAEVPISGTVWDPACGMGRIVSSATSAGLCAYGSDIVYRGPMCDEVKDFLSLRTFPEFNSIVSNPPFGIAEQFVQKSLKIIPKGGYAAFILPIVWMAGFSSKRNWMPSSPLRYVLPISPRPSMPPGAVIQAGVKPGNGTKDFAWFVWQSGYNSAPEVKFLNTNPYKSEQNYTNND